MTAAVQARARAWAPARALPLSWLLLLAACGSVPPTHYYTLPDDTAGTAAPAATAEGSAATAAPWPALQLLPLRVPDLLDRPQIVRRLSPTQVALSEYALWAQPLRLEATRVVAAELRRRWPRLALDGGAGAPRLALELLRLEIDGDVAEALRAASQALAAALATTTATPR